MNTVGERRKSIRFEIPFEAAYSLAHSPAHPSRWVNCAGKNFSRYGVGLFIKETIDENRDIDLDIKLPEINGHYPARGRIVWLGKDNAIFKKGFYAGVKITDMRSSDKAEMLNYAYNIWRSRI